MREIYEILETDDHGKFLKIKDLDVGDQFDDYLAEEVYVLSYVSCHPRKISWTRNYSARYWFHSAFKKF